MTPLWRDEPDGARTYDAGPWLLCLDLQREFVAEGRPLRGPAVKRRVEACRALLGHARDAGWPVIHVHRRRESGLFGAASEFSRPVESLEPLAREALFFRSGLSAFTAPGLRRLVPPAPGTRVFLAALSLDNGCLATVMHAADIGLKVTVAEDVLGAAPLGPYGPGVVAGVAKRLIAPFVRFETAQSMRRSGRLDHDNRQSCFEGNETWPA
jgi:hypothetical protein